MKSKILILLLFCSFFTFGQSVPNTNTFSLQDVVNVVGGTSLTQAFSNSTDAYFDPTYKGSKDRLSNFRNYTIPSCVPPTVTTTTITAITSSGASSGGNVTADGGCSVTGRGIQWSYYSNFSSILGSTSNGTGTGFYTSTMSGLADNTTFYVRAYATNSAGTGYGATLSFTTLPSCTLPTVTTSSITAILATSATGGGNVTATGGCAVTARGVCWSTSNNPTISNSHTTNGTGTGSFTSSITGLTCGTTYYVRAYATSSAGTSYGSEVSFTTTTLNFASVTINNFISTSCGIYNINSEATAKQAYLDWINGSCIRNSPSLSGYVIRIETLSVGKSFYKLTVPCVVENLTGWFMITSGYVIQVSSGTVTTVISYPW